MAKKFFPDEWEKMSKEELVNARCRLSGCIESTTEKEKTIRDVSIEEIIVPTKNTFLICLNIMAN